MSDTKDKEMKREAGARRRRGAGWLLLGGVAGALVVMGVFLAMPVVYDVAVGRDGVRTEAGLVDLVGLMEEIEGVKIHASNVRRGDDEMTCFLECHGLWYECHVLYPSSIKELIGGEALFSQARQWWVPKMSAGAEVYVRSGDFAVQVGSVDPNQTVMMRKLAGEIHDKVMGVAVVVERPRWVEFSQKLMLWGRYKYEEWGLWVREYWKRVS